MKKYISLLLMIFFLTSKLFCQTTDQIIVTLNKLIEDRKTNFKNTRDTLFKKDDVEQQAAYRCKETLGSNNEAIVDEIADDKTVFLAIFDYSTLSKEKIDSVKDLIRFMEIYIDAINISIKVEADKFLKREYNDSEKYFVTELSDQKGDLVLTLSTALDEKYCSIMIYGKGYPRPKMYKRNLQKSKEKKQPINKSKKIRK
jgi:hypothetical protein